MIEINENYKEQLDSITTTMMQSNFKLADKFKASILDQKRIIFLKHIIIYLRSYKNACF